jgi:hypothetical protein
MGTNLVIDSYVAWMMETEEQTSRIPLLHPVLFRAAPDIKRLRIKAQAGKLH